MYATITATNAAQEIKTAAQIKKIAKENNLPTKQITKAIKHEDDRTKFSEKRRKEGERAHPNPLGSRVKQFW